MSEQNLKTYRVVTWGLTGHGKSMLIGGWMIKGGGDNNPKHLSDRRNWQLDPLNDFTEQARKEFKTLSSNRERNTNDGRKVGPTEPVSVYQFRVMDNQQKPLCNLLICDVPGEVCLNPENKTEHFAFLRTFLLGEPISRIKEQAENEESNDKLWQSGAVDLKCLPDNDQTPNDLLLKKTDRAGIVVCICPSRMSDFTAPGDIGIHHRSQFSLGLTHFLSTIKRSQSSTSDLVPLDMVVCFTQMDRDNVRKYYKKNRKLCEIYFYDHDVRDQIQRLNLNIHDLPAYSTSVFGMFWDPNEKGWQSPEPGMDKKSSPANIVPPPLDIMKPLAKLLQL